MLRIKLMAHLHRQHIADKLSIIQTSLPLCAISTFLSFFELIRKREQSLIGYIILLGTFPQIYIFCQSEIYYFIQNVEMDKKEMVLIGKWKCCHTNLIWLIDFKWQIN